MIIEKAVPVVLRQRGGIEILAFVHPLAGKQIVKGTIEAGEVAEAAAIRELAEEAGITDGRVSGGLGSLIGGSTWHFERVAVGDLPEEWRFRTKDDGGHDFEFFWHPLTSDAGDDWDPQFRQALAFIRSAVG